MKKEQETTREIEREQDRLEIIEMPVKITKVPAILAPVYEHLKTETQLIIQRRYEIQRP